MLQVSNAEQGAESQYHASRWTQLTCPYRTLSSNQVDLFFHVFAGQLADDQQFTGDGRAISAQDMSFILHTMADTVWKLRGGASELRIPSADIDTLAVEMFYLADSDMNGVVEWNEFEIWGNSQLKSKSLINRITPLPKQPDVSALSALAYVAAVALVRVIIVGRLTHGCWHWCLPASSSASASDAASGGWASRTAPSPCDLSSPRLATRARTSRRQQPLLVL